MEYYCRRINAASDHRREGREGWMKILGIKGKGDDSIASFPVRIPPEMYSFPTRRVASEGDQLTPTR
jgi:hypothetical protein